MNENPMSFEEAHPFVIGDGRRFASLFCAAHTIFNEEPQKRIQLLPVVCGPFEYGLSECSYAQMPNHRGRNIGNEA